MKTDEIQLLILVNNNKFVRDIINESTIDRNRALYILRKWCEKGWYEYGTSLDLGWLTDQGKRVAEDNMMKLLKNQFPQLLDRLILCCTRKQRLDLLVQYFCLVLSEDPQNSTVFDIDVINTINELKNKYSNE